jgi:hypothetical protein
MVGVTQCLINIIGCDVSPNGVTPPCIARSFLATVDPASIAAWFTQE